MTLHTRKICITATHSTSFSVDYYIGATCYILLVRPWRQSMFHWKAKVSTHVQKQKCILWKYGFVFNRFESLPEGGRTFELKLNSIISHEVVPHFICIFMDLGCLRDYFIMISPENRSNDSKGYFENLEWEIWTVYGLFKIPVRIQETISGTRPNYLKSNCIM